MYFTWGIFEGIIAVAFIIMVGVIWRFVGIAHQTFVFLEKQKRRSKTNMLIWFVVAFSVLLFSSFDTGTQRHQIDKTVFNQVPRTMVLEKVQAGSPSPASTQAAFDQLTESKQIKINKEISE